MQTLRETRRRKLYSIGGLASAASVATKTIVDIEHGRTVPRFQTMRALSGALKVDPLEIAEFRRASQGGEETGQKRDSGLAE